MRIPEPLEKILKADRELHAVVLSAISRTNLWLSQVPMVFFSEFTRHDNKHNEEVLQTAFELIPETALPHLSPGDVASLILSILLHDSAMHLSEAGFTSLIGRDSIWKPILPLDTKSWHDLWTDFLSEAARFDGRKLSEILGDANRPASRPPEDFLDWTERDRRLIGEFVRRNHARLAHEIARYGVPGVDGKPFAVLDDSAPSFLRDISGFIARSHGIELRSTFEYLSANYDLRDYNRIHAVYVMTLVRISDYLQIQPDRAPQRALQLKKIRSPLSRQEWSVHACVHNITLTTMDPEAIDIRVTPEDAQIYLRLKQWLGGIQYELDMSWAALGEVYGRFGDENLNAFGLHLRRVRSNMDDIAAFQRSVRYLPDKIAFESAGTDLLKLLIGPLYGGDISVGIRELLQNAVDAVRERDQAEGRIQSGKAIVAKLIYSGNADPEFFEISDTGIGMNAHILKEFFLKAGASFRKSDWWKQQFEDDKAQSSIARSGRFGVGALAAFLLGDRIEVETRRYDAAPEDGLYFEASLDDQTISVYRKSCEVGTRIRIRLSRAAAAFLSENPLEFMDWYWLPRPNLALHIHEEEVETQGASRLPDIGEDACNGWARTSSERYEQINWTYFTVEHAKNRYAHTYVNGIPIKMNRRKSDFASWRERTEIKGRISEFFWVPSPLVSVIDNNGLFPLNLARNQLATDVTNIEGTISNYIARDYIVGCFLNTELLDSDDASQWTAFPWEDSALSHFQFQYVGHISGAPWVFTRSGIYPCDYDLLLQAGIKTLVAIPYEGDLLKRLIVRIQTSKLKHVGVVGYSGNTSEGDLLSAFRYVYGRGGTPLLKGLYASDVGNLSFGWVHKSAYQRMRKANKPPRWLDNEIDLVTTPWTQVGRSSMDEATFNAVASEILKTKPNSAADSIVGMFSINPRDKDQWGTLCRNWLEMAGPSYVERRRRRKAEAWVNDVRNYELLRKKPSLSSPQLKKPLPTH